MCTYLSRGAKIGKPFKPQELPKISCVGSRLSYSISIPNCLLSVFFLEKNLNGAPAILAQVMRNMFSPQNVITVCLHPFSFCYGIDFFLQISGGNMNTKKKYMVSQNSKQKFISRALQTKKEHMCLLADSGFFKKIQYVPRRLEGLLFFWGI